MFDIVRVENFDKGGGEKVIRPAESRKEAEDGPKIINWRLLASLLDYNRIQPWERPAQDQCIEENPCLPHVVECRSIDVRV